MLRNVLVAVVFGAAAIVGVWDLLQIQSFDNALLQFATAGVVPGTHTELTPGQMFVVLSVVLLLVIIVMFRKSLARDWHEFTHASFGHSKTGDQGKRAAPAELTYAAATTPSHAPIVPNTVEPAAAPASAVAVTQPETAGPPAAAKRPLIVITIPATPGPVIRYARAFIAWLRPASKTAWQWAKLRSAHDVRRLAEITVRAVRDIKKQSIRGWRWAEPRIREVDSYIERRLKQNKKAATAIRELDRLYQQGHERLNSWRSHGRQSTGQSPADAPVEK